MNTLLALDADVILGYSEDILVLLGVCVVLPCLIVYFVMKSRRHEIDRKTEVALKAIESGVQIDPDFFAEPKKSKKKNTSIKSSVFGYLIPGFILSFLGLAFCTLALLTSKTAMLIPGAILLFLGLAFLLIYFIARHQFADEIRAEEEKINKAE